MDFLKTLSTALHAYWPPSLVLSILTAVLIQRAGMIPQEEMVNLVKSHPGAFLAPDTPAWLGAIASTFSVFNIWTVVLLVLGFKIVGKLSTGKAAFAALGSSALTPQQSLDVARSNRPDMESEGGGDDGGDEEEMEEEDME